MRSLQEQYVFNLRLQDEDQVPLSSFILVTVQFLFQAHVYCEGNDVYDVMLNQVKYLHLITS